MPERGPAALSVLSPLLVLVLLVASCSNGAGDDVTTTTDPDPTTTVAAPTTVVTTPVPEETTTTTTQPLAIEDPEDAFVAFLAAMREGGYEDAERLYGGTYEVLIEWNETVDPSDQVALLEAACTFQLHCHLLREIAVDDTAPAGIFGFLVAFEYPDGEPVTRYNPADDTTTTQFEFRVIEEGDGYLVLDLSLYFE